MNAFDPQFKKKPEITIIFKKLLKIISEFNEKLLLKRFALAKQHKNFMNVVSKSYRETLMTSIQKKKKKLLFMGAKIA